MMSGPDMSPIVKNANLNVMKATVVFLLNGTQVQILVQCIANYHLLAFILTLRAQPVPTQQICMLKPEPQVKGYITILSLQVE